MKKIEKKVEEIKNEFNLSEKYYFDIVKIAKKLGFIIGNANLRNEDGFLAIDCVKRKRIIGVNEKAPLSLKRYILAYALGLFYLNESQEPFSINSINLETEHIDIHANSFATSLLVSEETFCNIYHEFEEKGLKEKHLCLVLSELYKVPVEVIRSRKNELMPQVNQTSLSTYYQECEDKEIVGASKTLKKMKNNNL